VRAGIRLFLEGLLMCVFSLLKNRKLAEVAYEVIKTHMDKAIRGSYEKPQLSRALRWLHETVIPWLSKVFYHHNHLAIEGVDQKALNYLGYFATLLQTYLLSTYSEIRCRFAFQSLFSLYVIVVNISLFLSFQPTVLAGLQSYSKSLWTFLTQSPP